MAGGSAQYVSKWRANVQGANFKSVLVQAFPLGVLPFHQETYKSIYEDATPRSASILIDIFRTYSLNKTRSVCGRLLQYSSCPLGAIKATSTSRKISKMPTKTVLPSVHPRRPGKELAFNKRCQNGQLNSYLSVCV